MEFTTEKMRENKLRWFERVMRRGVMEINIEMKRERGKPKEK